ncbi:hypothetical protein MTR67_040322 [Solanum verrucosum]|uniref:Uncharacterized protein n=1 Tax=Solanum verrucosum TaxID=315347 RepID=A0AAF0ZPB9_SOLVR|nr:hypothetical protein MTR67_040322 [Solanum verrucosum]
MEQPPYREGKYDLQLGLYGSDLCGYVNNWRKCVSLWVMKKSWTKILTIKYDYSLFLPVLPFFMSNKGEIVVGFSSTNIMIYNPKDDSLRLASIDFNNSETEICCYAEIYVESRVSPFSTGRTTGATILGSYGGANDQDLGTNVQNVVQDEDANLGANAQNVVQDEDSNEQNDDEDGGVPMN